MPHTSILIVTTCNSDVQVYNVTSLKLITKHKHYLILSSSGCLASIDVN